MGLKVIRTNAFREKLGVGETLFHELKKTDPDFPKPIALSERARGYIESECDAYIESKREGAVA